MLELFTIIPLIISIASVVAKLTPTEVDNKVVAFALKFIDFLAINNVPTKLRK